MSEVRNTEREEYPARLNAIREEVDRILLEAQTLRSQKKRPSPMRPLGLKVEIREYEGTDKRGLLGRLHYKKYKRYADKCLALNARIEKENRRIEEEYRAYCRNIRAYNEKLESRAAVLEMYAEKIVAELDEHI